MTTMQYESKSPAHTRRIAAGIAKTLSAGAVLAISGDIGAGKTCFVQGLATALGIREPTVSPTFVLIREYSGPIPLFHMDLYRLTGTEEARQAGLEEYFDRNGITAIEWADRIENIFPDHTIHIKIEITGRSTRRIKLKK